VAFDAVWNPTYEGLPSDAEDINLGASRIRSLKVNIRERIAVDHSFAGDANDGLHLHTELIPQSPAPTPVNASDGVVYAATISSVTELFYKDNAGHTLQLTSNGGYNITSLTLTTLTLSGALVVGTTAAVNGALAVAGLLTSESGTAEFTAPAATESRVHVNADAGQSAFIQYDAGTSQRWLAGRVNNAESGGNTGSDYEIARVADNGVTVLGIPLLIRRSDGAIFIQDLPTSAPSGSHQLWSNGGVLTITP
jgi:hypothetical protein